MAKVSINGTTGTDDSTAPAGTAGTGPPNNNLANIDAVKTTITTRRYCMKPTRRTSAPNSPDISTIAEAAPGELPQAAVVPGSVPSFTNTHPTKPPASTVVLMTSSMIGQSRATDPRIAGVNERATKHPMIPWLNN